MRIKPLKIVLPIIFLAAFGVIVTFMLWENGSPPITNQPANVMERAKFNYGDEVKKYSSELNLPYEYFMALIVLECSGNRPSGTRFEPHVHSSGQATECASHVQRVPPRAVLVGWPISLRPVNRPRSREQLQRGPMPRCRRWPTLGIRPTSPRASGCVGSTAARGVEARS